METIITLPCEELLQDARRTFGNHLVVGAWFADTCEPTHASREQLQADVASYEPDESCGIAVPTHGMIIFEFLNGRKVAFSTSEWAHIFTVEDHLVAL